MINLGLNARQKWIFRDTLTNPHQMRIRVQTADLNGNFVGDLTPRVLDGQVDVDATADVTRTLSMTLLDWNGTLSFDSDSPSEAALFMDRMIRVWYGVRCPMPDGWEWVDVPIFTGPISGLSRTGNEVSVEAQGKEVMAMGATWRPLAIRKGTTKVSAIRIILRERAGERRFDLPALKARLPNQFTLNRQDVPWNRAKQLARSLGGRQLFYDGRGTVRLRVRPARSVITLTYRSMLSPLQINYSAGEVVNTVLVRGGVPKGQKKQITAEIFPDRKHPLSPWRLGRTNSQGVLVPRYLLDVIEDDTIRSLAEARRIGRERLQRGLAQAVDASMEILPLPHLEPGDLVRATTDQGAVTFRLRQFSIPLTAGEGMTVGYLRNVSPRRRRGQPRRVRGVTVRPIRSLRPTVRGGVGR